MPAGTVPIVHAVVGQRAAIIENPVNAGAEAAAVRDIEGTVERQVTGDVEQRLRVARRAERDIDIGGIAERQRAHRQSVALLTQKRAAIGDVHRASSVPMPPSDAPLPTATVPPSVPLTRSVPAPTVVVPAKSPEFADS